jgi:flagellar basal-body rod protein FlgC
MIEALDISSSALIAQRTRMDVIAGNIANAFTTQQEDGTIRPYRRRYVTFSTGRPGGGAGVRVTEIREHPSPFQLVHDPGHPHANADGYVAYPNVSTTKEYIDAMLAARAYEANVAMMKVGRDMMKRAIQLFA